MKITIYTGFSMYFGSICASWRNHFNKYGEKSEVIDLRPGWEGKLPVVEDSDVNIIVAGGMILKLIMKYGLPTKGKNVLWMFDPLSEINSHWNSTRQAMNATGTQFSALIGMDDFILSYFKEHFPQIPSFMIPSTIDPANISNPLVDTLREIDVLYLACIRVSPRRIEAMQLFQRKNFPVNLITGGLCGDQRDKVLSESRISLNINTEAGSYFNQFRTFMAWARGSVIVSEPSLSLDEFGVIPGKHLVIETIENMPETCKMLLADSKKRHTIAEAAQDLLRKKYLPDNWYKTMMKVLLTT